MSMYMPEEAKKRASDVGPGVKACDPPDVDAGSQTQGLCESSKCS